MIEVFLKDNEDYTKNGNANLFPTYCNVIPELNKVWTLELEHPIDSYGKWKYVVEGNRLRVNSFNGEQLFSIIKVKKSDAGVYAKAYPVFMESAGDCILLDTRPVNKNGQDALNIILRSNSKYSASSNITKTATSYFTLKNAMEAITNEENGFLARWGGEIYFNNYEIIINDRVGGDYGVSILYGKNLKTDGLSETVDIENVVTRIIPKAFNGYILPGSTPWVDSEYIDSYPTIKTKVIEYPNIRLASDVTEEDTSGLIICETMTEVYNELRKAANKEYENGIDKPDVTIECEMVLLQNTEEYKNFKNLEFVSLGDTIYCQHDKLGITTTARVTSMEWDCLTEKVTSVTIGSKSKSFIDKITTSVNSTIKALTPNGGVIAEQVQGLINGAKAQLRLQNTVAKKQDVRAILFEDLDPQSPTFGASSYGTQGWQISKKRTVDGRDWEWTTAATSSGIIANSVVTGILSDKLGRNYWNLETGDFRLQSVLIDGYVTDQELESVTSELSTFESAINKAIEGLQDQIDGIVDTWYYPGEPSLNKPPVTYDGSDPDTGWTTEADKRTHIGDIYYDTDTDYAYRFQFENNIFSWKKISDSDVSEALRIAREAQTTADTKRRVFLSTPTPPYDIGDVWMQGENGDILVCVTAKTGSQSYVASDFAKRNKYVDSATVDNKITVYNTWLDQVKVFNKLTNNGALQGIYMENGQLYINGSYIHSGVIDGDLITAGVLRDKAGLNYWNMVTGEFNLTGGTIGPDVTLRGLDELEFGGTQLLSQDLSIDTPTSYNFYRIPFFEPLIAGQEYTLQFWDISLDSNSSGIGVYWGGGSNKLIPQALFPDENGYIKVTFTVTEAQTKHSQAENLWLNLYNYVNGHEDARATIKQWKLEKGNKTTDWSLASQDVEKYIGNAETSASNALTAATAAQSTADGNTQKLEAMYGECSTPAATAAKEVRARDFKLYNGATINVLFTYTNSVANPTLNVNSTGAKPIYAYGSRLTATSNYWWQPNELVQFTYNSTSGRWIMQIDNQTATFNKLTQGGTKQGITIDSNGNLYINASYINSGYLSADRIEGNSIATTKLKGSIGNGDWGIDFTNNTMKIGTLEVASIKGILGDNSSTGGTYINFDTDTVVVRKLDASAITTGYLSADRIGGNSIDTAKLKGSIYNGDWGIDFTNNTMTIGTLRVGSIKGILGDNSSTGGTYINFDTDTVVVRNLNASAITTGILKGVTIAGDTIKVGGKSGDTTGQGGKIYVYNASGSQIGKWDESGINVTSGSIKGTTITGGTISGAQITSTGSYGSISIHEGGLVGVFNSPSFSRIDLTTGRMSIENNRYNTWVTPGIIALWKTGDSTGVSTNGLRISRDEGIYYKDQEYAYYMTAKYINEVMNYARASSGTIRLYNGVYAGSCSSSSRTEFFVPCSRDLSNVNGATVRVSGSMYFRTINGAKTMSQSTFNSNATVEINQFGFRVIIASGLSGVTVDTPLTACHSTGSGYLTFTLS